MSIQKSQIFISCLYFSVPELLSVAYSVSELESNILKHGLKEKFRTGTATEEATITSYQGLKFVNKPFFYY